MRKIILLAGILTLPVFASGDHEFKKQINPAILVDELKASGYNADSISGLGTNYIIRWGAGGEAKNPAAIIAAHIYVNPETKRDNLKADIAALAVKLRADTITSDEKDDLLDKMLQQMGY